MATQTAPLTDLYDADETAWLDLMSRLVAEGRVGDLDLDNLAEYLSDMAKRDRREVESRLAVLIAHLLKWRFQADRRSRSWATTIEQQRLELRRLLKSQTLRNHAEATLAEVYDDALKLAVVETGLTTSDLPTECPWTLVEIEEESVGDELA